MRDGTAPTTSANIGYTVGLRRCRSTVWNMVPQSFTRRCGQGPERTRPGGACGGSATPTRIMATDFGAEGGGAAYPRGLTTGKNSMVGM